MSVRAAPGVRWAPVADGLVIYEPATSRFVDLNGSGADLWALLVAECWDTARVVGRLAGEFDLEPEDAARFVDAFVSRLVEAGVLAR
jgi:hypothetical protein